MPPLPSTAVDDAPINCRRLHPTAASVDNHRLCQRQRRRRRPSPTNTPLTAASINDEDGHRPPTPSTAAAAVNDDDGHQRRPPPPSTEDVIVTATSFDVDVDGGGKDATYRHLPSMARTAIDRRRCRSRQRRWPSAPPAAAIDQRRHCHCRPPSTSSGGISRSCLLRVPPVFPPCSPTSLPYYDSRSTPPPPYSPLCLLAYKDT